jgi:predicted CoA-substrate-specific enzyme activase
MKQAGIDIGSSSIEITVLEGNHIEKTWSGNHHGSLLATLKEGLQAIDEKEPLLLGITGANALILRDYMKQVPSVEMVPAISEGARLLCPQGRSVIEIGGQGSRFISDIQAAVPQFHANEHCAGGTGAFFEDQMQRLGMKIEEYLDIVSKAESVPAISGRCAVFAKTDIIHRQQEGVQSPDILNGLFYALVRNYRAVIMRSLPLHQPVVFTGGVTRNSGMKKAILDVLKLEDQDLVIPDHAECTASIGAAVLAQKKCSLQDLQEAIASAPLNVQQEASLPRLVLEEGVSLKNPPRSEKGKDGLYLGIDIGSTSTDLVLMDEEGSLVDYQYLRTAGNPEKAVRTGLNAIRKKYGEIRFQAVGITGSGRVRVGKMIGADVIRDEITAQAEGACAMIPDVDTVFEIGGQDSKYISIQNGHVVDFQMNKICAAGTGSFVEEQASRMNIPLEKFGAMAMKSQMPAKLGERCTVFIQTSIDSAIGKGAAPEDISAGLAYSIVRNYLEKVVGEKKVGSRIVLQGGVCYNPSIVAAFEAAYPHKTIVSPYFPVSGAYGAALLAKKAGIKESTFKGYDFPAVLTKNEEISERVRKNTEFFHRSEKMLMGDYTGEIDPHKKTVGIPYVLLMHHFFPFAYSFFKDLGFNVLLSDPSNADTIRLSQEKAVGETCYPVKLMYGHIQQLIDHQVDYIFMPLVHTMKHENTSIRYNYGCMYMQSAASSIANLLHAQDKGIQLLNPVLDLDMGKQEMAKAMVSVGISLGFSKPRALKALMKGAMAFRKYNAAVEEQGKELLSNIRPDEKVFVIVTRPYGIADPVLNMHIPDLLLERGQKVITMEHLPGHDVDLQEDYPDLCWPFGQHIISVAKMIYHHPNLYAVYLTNHGCGPDTMLMHLFADEMKDKPYLQIEVDEQYSSVGVITRLEAFLNSIETRKAEKLPEDFDLLEVSHTSRSLYSRPLTDRTLKLPYMGVYTDLLKPWFEAESHVPVKIMKPFSPEVIRKGKELTRTKEYLPFAALGGEILMEEGKGQYYIPSSLGSEADGLYAQGLYSALTMHGRKDVTIIREPVETFSEKHKNYKDFFLRILAGDILMQALPADRKRMMQKAEQIHTYTEKELQDLCSLVRKDSRRQLGVVGTPLTETVLSEGVLDRLEKEYALCRAPLSEYLLFLWQEEGMACKDLEILIHEVHAWLPKPNAFTENMDLLHITADQYLWKVNGGNIRYRLAKTIQISDHMPGILETSPRYENADMVMTMRGLETHCACPVYHLSFDGDWDEGAGERLRSFLFYMKR